MDDDYIEFLEQRLRNQHEMHEKMGAFIADC